MMVDQPRYKTSDEVDFVIIGSGRAGGILAKETFDKWLSRRGAGAGSLPDGSRFYAQ